MASGLYGSFKELLLSGGVDLATADVRVILVDTADYAADLVADDNLDDVPVAARVATSGAMSSKTVAAGVFDAADVTFPSVTGDTVEAAVLYVHTGVESTSTLIAYVDGLVLTPNGSSVTLAWDNAASKIFAL